MRLAIAGLGVSGLAVARAAADRGDSPTVFDQKPATEPQVLQAVERLDAIGVPSVTLWPGRLEPSEFDALVVSPGFPGRHPAIHDMLEAGKEVLSEVEYAGRIARAPILAITGTNGKSTCTVLAWHLLRAAGVEAVLCGNIAGSGYPEMPLTQAAHEAPAHAWLVAEVSSFQLEWVSQFRPRVAAITKVTPDHLDRHPTFDDYYQTKLRLLQAQGPGDTVVFNLAEPSLDNEAFRGAGAGARRGFDPSGMAEAPGGVTRRQGDHILLGTRTLTRSDLPLFGEHSVANLMLAWEMADVALDGATPAQEAAMEAAVRDFRGLAHRMEVVGERDGVLVVNNSMCTNPDAVLSALAALPRRKWLLMGGLRKNLDFTPVGAALAAGSDQVALFGPEPEALQAQVGPWPIYPDLESAFHACARAAQPGDAILLAPGCASAEPYRSFRERGEAFREMARTWIEEAQR